MRNPPPEVMATWPAPNYVNPERRGDALIIVEACMMSAAFITLMGRMYVRAFIVKMFGPDDWIMVAATIFGIGVTICVFLSDQLYGWSIHIWDLTLSQAIKGRQVSIAAQTLFLFSSGLAKVSILVSYLRIAPNNSWFRRLTWASIFVVSSLIVAYLMVLWTQCIPMDAYWHPDGLEHCKSESARVVSQAITTIFADLIVVALPLPTLLTLNLPRFERAILAVLFSLGIVVVVAACMRTYWSHYVTVETYDVTWQGFYLWIWTAVEANLGVICGNIPALRPLFKGWYRSFSSSYYINSKGSHHRSRARGASNASKSARWSENMMQGNKGIKVPDDQVDIESDAADIESADIENNEIGVYELRQQRCKSSATSSLELDGWPPHREQRLPDHSPGPLAGP
ncbi:hypothetical protein BGZ63DRAFT_366137 [Mariannaea sp. PMI_226]|nr:hypothetical protein BGZ63DRAFT_366137 [Mariannaea sp. PMI_226]